MAEYRLHHLVSELLTTLSSANNSHISSKASPEVYVDYLNSQRSQAKSSLRSAGAGSSKASSSSSSSTKIPSYALLPHIQQSVSKIANSQEAGSNFLAIYDHLHRQQLKELDSFLYVLHKIHTDADVTKVLNVRFQPPGPSHLLDVVKDQKTSMSVKRGHISSDRAAAKPLTERISVSTSSLTDKKRQPSRSLPGSTTSLSSNSTPPVSAPAGSSKPAESRERKVSVTMKDMKNKIGTEDRDRQASNSSTSTTTSNNTTSSSVKPITSGIVSFGGVDNNSIADNTSTADQQPLLNSLSVAEQERLIITDLLYVLIGIEGQFIQFAPVLAPKPDKKKKKRREFRYAQEPTNRSEDPVEEDEDEPEEVWKDVEFLVDETLDPTLMDMITRTLPLARDYMLVNRFVESHARFEFGRVNHALCGGIRGLLKEYLLLITQLETLHTTTPNFSLQKMWYYIHPTLHTMSSLCGLVADIRVAEEVAVEDDDEFLRVIAKSEDRAYKGRKIRCGGVLLGVIWDRMATLGGDPLIRALHSHLLSLASAPYLEMLQVWLKSGTIDDPYEEFMIAERRHVKKESLSNDYAGDIYWEQRYSLREDAVPPFLEAFKEKILLAGKYLNVCREWKKSAWMDLVAEQQRLLEQVELSSTSTATAAAAGGDPNTLGMESKWINTIETAYKVANKTLLDVLLKEEQLVARLKSLKHYFFLDASDFLTHFLDLALPELSKPTPKISLTKLQSLLEIVLRNPSSVSYSDLYKDDLKVELSTMTLIEQLLKINLVGAPSKKKRSSLAAVSGVSGSAHEALRSEVLDKERKSEWENMGGLVGGDDAKKNLTGIDAFMLNYTVRFPLSLILNRKSLTKYQLLFRHLFYCKYVERLLGATWIDQKRMAQAFKFNHASGASSSAAEPQEIALRSTLSAMRSKMLNFVQQLLYYTCFEVLEPNWSGLEQQLSKVSTVDEVLEYHGDFLDTCLKECMLTNPKLLKIFSSLMKTCTDFCALSEQFFRNYHLEVVQSENARKGSFKATSPTETTAPSSGPSLSLAEFQKSLAQCDAAFVSTLKHLIDTLQYYATTESASFGNLVTRLDFNLFYARGNANGYISKEWSGVWSTESSAPVSRSGSMDELSQAPRSNVGGLIGVTY